MMAVTYSILSYTFHLFRRINYYFIPWRLFYVFQWSFTHCPTCSFKSTIHVSLHILIIYLNMWYYVQYVYSFFIFIIRFYFLRLFLLLSESPLPAFLSIIIKAYSMGIFNCHTTNILIRWFYCVHWIKPPFHKFPINDISPTYEIFSYPW